jgi:hypothetical protein
MGITAQQNAAQATIRGGGSQLVRARERVEWFERSMNEQPREAGRVHESRGATAAHQNSNLGRMVPDRAVCSAKSPDHNAA